MPGETPTSPRLPVLAAAGATAYLASLFWPGLLPLLAVMLPVAFASLVLARRRSAPLRLALTVIAVWLAVGVAGVWLLQDRAVPGLLWVLVVLFALPLPLFPWLYWRSFEASDDSEQPVRSPVPGPRSPLPPNGSSS
jgi:hypothetical protein